MQLRGGAEHKLSDSIADFWGKPFGVGEEEHDETKLSENLDELGFRIDTFPWVLVVLEFNCIESVIGWWAGFEELTAGIIFEIVWGGSDFWR